MSDATTVVSGLLDAARSALVSHQIAASGTDPQVIRLPETATAELIRALARTAVRLWQIVPFPGRTGEADLFSLLVWRQHAASEQHEVRRLYLIPFGFPDVDRVDLQVDDDSRAGIIVDRMYIGGNHNSGAAETAVPLTNTWIVDDRVVVFQEHGDSGPPSWVVSARTEDVGMARERWARLWERRSEAAHKQPRVPEPLLESADLLHTIAQFSCTADHVDRESCVWYHGFWQYLRLFNMVSSPNWHARFYEEALRRELHGKPRARVLITGAADYGVLAYVLAAVEQPSALDIHVLDLCFTPLLANRWFARQHGLEIKVHDLDFLADGAETARLLGAFDLIVTDAFLTRFEQPDAETVVANWHRMLRPGGSVVTTVRLYDAEASEDDMARAQTDYLLRLYERAKHSHWLLQVGFDDLRHGAHRYIQKMDSKSLGGKEDVLALFARNELHVTVADPSTVEGELAETEYLRIVCRR